jgi:arabinofuranosyltransferase
MNNRHDFRFGIALLVLVFTVLVIRNAWVSDDAYITFRTIENFTSGYGLTYNPYVRVQSFTHPLWMFLLSAFYVPVKSLLFPSASDGLYFLSLAVSIVSSAFMAFLLLTKVLKKDLASLTLFGSAIVLSRALMDYSTSGLENPLSHILLAFFLWKCFDDKPNILSLSFIAALIACNRLDLLLLVAPILVLVFWQQRDLWRKNILSLLIGFSPILLWEMFSLFYYGFPFPNTAYAKLNTGIENTLLVSQGIDYFLNSLYWDPVTLFVIGLAGFVAVLEKEKKSLFIYAGILLYLVYVVKIGGDFMSGRFFTAPFLFAAVVISRARSFSLQSRFAGAAVIVVLGVFSFRSTLFDSQLSQVVPGYELIDRNGIADERLFYFHQSYNRGLVVDGVRNTQAGSFYAGNRWILTGEKSVSAGTNLGFRGYEAGPNVYFVDVFALVDPLLARLPINDKTQWRIGHFSRDLPRGYLDTLNSGQMRISNSNLALYYQKLSFVITGPLWSWDRLVEIWKFNTGQYDYLTLNDFRSASEVSILLGQPGQAEGLHLTVSRGDGLYRTADVSGLPAIQTVPLTANQYSYLYFLVDDTFYLNSPQDISLTVTYFDEGNEPIYLQYDAADLASPLDLDRAYKSVLLALRHNSQTWQTATIRILDATFANHQNNGADFRLAAKLANLTAREVKIEKAP